MVTDLGKRIDAVVDAAMQTGDWTLFDAYRAIFAEDPKHPVNAALLERMDIGREAARCLRGLRRIMVAASESGDAETKADFLAMANAIKLRIDAVAATSRTRMASRKGIRERWEQGNNAVNYAAAITLAKNLMAVGHDREHILKIVGKEKCVKHLKPAQLARILRENKALPGARKKRSDG